MGKKNTDDNKVKEEREHWKKWRGIGRSSGFNTKEEKETRNKECNKRRRDGMKWVERTLMIIN